MQHKIDIGITTIAVSNTLRNKVGGNRLTGGDLDGAAQLLAYPPGVTQGNRQLIKQTFQPARQLLTRLNDGTVTEVIIATDPNLEGEATATYLTRLLVQPGLRVTRLASGLPVGGDLEYADEVTLGRAFEGRRLVEN